MLYDNQDLQRAVDAMAEAIARRLLDVAEATVGVPIDAEKVLRSMANEIRLKTSAERMADAIAVAQEKR